MDRHNFDRAISGGSKHAGVPLDERRGQVVAIRRGERDFNRRLGPFVPNASRPHPRRGFATALAKQRRGFGFQQCD